MNMIMCVVCMIIPAIGGIVLVGYLFEVVDFLRHDPNDKEYPDFKFDRAPQEFRPIRPGHEIAYGRLGLIFLA